VTEIREPGFSIDLPGVWEPAESDEPGSLVYREAAGPGTVTVMLLAVRPVYAIADKSRLHSDYMLHRSKFELGQQPSFVQTEPVGHEVDGAIEGSWSAYDADSDQRQLHRVVLSGNILADFRYEAPEADEAAFGDRAKAILDAASVTPEPRDDDEQGEAV